MFEQDEMLNTELNDETHPGFGQEGPEFGPDFGVHASTETLEGEVLQPGDAGYDAIQDGPSEEALNNSFQPQHEYLAGLNREFVAADTVFDALSTPNEFTAGPNNDANPFAHQMMSAESQMALADEILGQFQFAA